MIAAGVAAAALLVASGACNDGSSDWNNRPTVRRPPPNPDLPPVRPAPIPPAPSPGDPGYPDYFAASPLIEAQEQVALATLGFARARKRLSDLDAILNAARIRRLDEIIRALLKVHCSHEISNAHVDVDQIPVEQLFPLRYVEQAVTTTCVGLRLKHRIVETDIWTYKPDAPDAAPATSSPATGDAGIDAP